MTENTALSCGSAKSKVKTQSCLAASVYCVCVYKSEEVNIFFFGWVGGTIEIICSSYESFLRFSSCSSLHVPDGLIHLYSVLKICPQAFREDCEGRSESFSLFFSSDRCSFSFTFCSTSTSRICLYLIESIPLSNLCTACATCCHTTPKSNTFTCAWPTQIPWKKQNKTLVPRTTLAYPDVQTLTFVMRSQVRFLSNDSSMQALCISSAKWKSAPPPVSVTSFPP